MKNKKFINMFALLGVLTLGMNTFACTGFVAGKEVTADGSIMIGRTEDIGSGYNKNYVVVPRTEYKDGEFFEDLNGFKYPQPKISYKYTMVPDVVEHEDGIYAAAGINEYGVAMTATVSAYNNENVEQFDPLVEEGIREAAIPSVVLSQVKSAKEGVKLLGSIVEKYGSAEGNIILFADQDEAWYMEILSGHQWAAVKVPDDKYAVVPNAFMLGYIDLNDKENVLYSKNVINLPKEKGYLKTYNGKFHLALTYGETMTDGNRTRTWGGQNYFSPSQNIAFDQDVFELFLTPDDEIELDEVMDFQRYRYEGTEKDLSLPENKGVRAIGTENQAECHIIQMKEEYPDELGGLMWVAMGNAEHSVYLPTYAAITDTHEAYQVPGVNYSPSSAYWTFRSLSTLAELDRVNYGAGVRDFWKAYETALITQQEAVDDYFINLAKTNPSTVAGEATQLGQLITDDALDQAESMYSQLMTFVAKHGGGKTVKKPFAPAVSQEQE